MKLVKKLTVGALALGISLSAFGMNDASAATFSGKISYQPDSNLGVIGHDGKAMTVNDAAVDISRFYSIPKGRALFVKNNGNGKSATVYKWDSGNFASKGVVLDVFIPVYRDKLGGSLTAGYINSGTVTWY